ncbi:hypothetical protein BLOT_003561 [Blomia tropicalis]|nr:hypothetical protein BLOT_003561 [Blomia tropicalis]
MAITIDDAHSNNNVCVEKTTSIKTVLQQNTPKYIKQIKVTLNGPVNETIQTVSYFQLLIVDQFRKDEDDFVGGRRKLPEEEEEEEEGDRDHDPSP